MNACEAIIDIELKTNESRAMKRIPDDIEYKQKIAEIMRDRPIMWIKCPNCNGEGRLGLKDGQTVRDCPQCDGTGEVSVYADEGLEIYKEDRG